MNGESQEYKIDIRAVSYQYFPLKCELEPLKHLLPPHFSSCSHTSLHAELDILTDPATGFLWGLETLTSLRYTLYTAFPDIKEVRKFVYSFVFYPVGWFQAGSSVSFMQYAIQLGIVLCLVFKKPYSYGYYSTGSSGRPLIVEFLLAECSWIARLTPKNV